MQCGNSVLAVPVPRSVVAFLSLAQTPWVVPLRSVAVLCSAVAFLSVVLLRYPCQLSSFRSRCSSSSRHLKGKRRLRCR